MTAVIGAAAFTGCTKKAAADGSDKVYLIATDTTFAPFEFENAEGKFVGIDMDILDAVAKEWAWA